MISVVIPLYNKERQIAKTLRSVLCQTFQDFEIVIVNDGSTDNSIAEVEKNSDPRIRLINQTNAGVSVARNTGIEESKGEYVALLDADDEWYPDYLATQALLAETYTKCDIFAVNYRFCDAKGNITNTLLRNLPFTAEHGVLSNYFEVASTSHPPICSISIMARKKAFQAVNGFPVGIKSGEDLLTWARLACRYKIAFSTKTCAVYNLGPGYDFSNLPPRRQDSGDPVGTALKELLRENPKTSGLRKYISHWHKMRASVAIRYGERLETLREGLRCLLFNPLNYKVIPIILLSFLPVSVRLAIISKHRSK